MLLGSLYGDGGHRFSSYPDWLGLSVWGNLYSKVTLIQDLLVALLSKIAETTPDSPSSSQACFLPSAPQHLID